MRVYVRGMARNSKFATAAHSGKKVTKIQRTVKMAISSLKGTENQEWKLRK